MRDEMLKSLVIHTDDTPVDVRSAHTKEKYQARFWTYWGDEEHPLVWFDFMTNRKRAGPDNVLRDFFGYLQADGYGGYDDYEGIALSDDHPILKAACWVHVRRKFRDAPRSIGLGRKAWLFRGSEAGGHTAAAHFSLIASGESSSAVVSVWMCFMLRRSSGVAYPVEG